MAKIKLKYALRRLINYRWIISNIPFFLFLTGLTILYIANGHIADKTVRNINSTANDLKELQYEYKTVKSDLMFKSREEEIVKAASPLGLKLPVAPPVRIISEQKINQ